MPFPFKLVGRYSGAISFRRWRGHDNDRKSGNQTYASPATICFICDFSAYPVFPSRADTDRAMGTRTDAFGPEQAGAWWHFYTRWQTTMSNSAFSI
jgi:hypothetical protein